MLGLLALCGGALAQHRGDIVLDVTPDGIRTNQFDLDGNLTAGVRVFPMTLGAAYPGFSDSPGFDSLPGTFPYPSSNGFRIRKALRVWNGARFVHLPVSMPEEVDIAFATLGPVATPTCDAVTPGFTLTVGSNGEWHRHLEYTLADPGTPGVYLLELDLYSTNPGVGPSKPFWLVILQPVAAGAPSAAELSAQEDAVAWVQAHRVPQLCPADYNGDGIVGVQDIFDFLNDWFAGELDADANLSCTLEVQDIFDYLNAWFVGC
jgi:hypothetical protein